MEVPTLPLSFHYENAHLCLQKAALARKSYMFADELQHLKLFQSLLSRTVPSHPLYCEKKDDKQLMELQSCLLGVGQRLIELEGNFPVNESDSSATNRDAKLIHKSRRKIVRQPTSSSEETGQASRTHRSIEFTWKRKGEETSSYQSARDLPSFPKKENYLAALKKDSLDSIDSHTPNDADLYIYNLDQKIGQQRTSVMDNSSLKATSTGHQWSSESFDAFDSSLKQCFPEDDTSHISKQMFRVEALNNCNSLHLQQHSNQTERTCNRNSHGKSTASSSAEMAILRQDSRDCAQKSGKESRETLENLKHPGRVGIFAHYQHSATDDTEKKSPKRRRSRDNRRKLSRVRELRASLRQHANLKNIYEDSMDSDGSFSDVCFPVCKDNIELKPEVNVELDVPHSGVGIHPKLGGKTFVSYADSLQQIQFTENEAGVQAHSSQTDTGFCEDTHNLSNLSFSTSRHSKEFDELRGCVDLDKKDFSRGSHPLKYTACENRSILFNEHKPKGNDFEPQVHSEIKSNMVSKESRCIQNSTPKLEGKMKLEGKQNKPEARGLKKILNEEQEKMSHVRNQPFEKKCLKPMYAGKAKASKVENQKRVVFENRECEKGDDERPRHTSSREAFQIDSMYNERNSKTAHDAVTQLEHYRVKPLASKNVVGWDTASHSDKQQKKYLNKEKHGLLQKFSPLPQGLPNSSSSSVPSFPLSDIMQKDNNMALDTESCQRDWRLQGSDASLVNSNSPSFNIESDIGGRTSFDQQSANVPHQNRMTFSNPVFDLDSTSSSRVHGSDSKLFQDASDSDGHACSLQCPNYDLKDKVECRLGTKQEDEALTQLEVDPVSCLETTQDKGTYNFEELLELQECREGAFPLKINQLQPINVTDETKLLSGNISPSDKKSSHILYCDSETFCRKDTLKFRYEQPCGQPKEEFAPGNSQMSPTNSHKMQIEEMEKRLHGIQKTVSELKNSTKSSSSVEESFWWKTRFENMRKELDTLKLETNTELRELKQMIKVDLKVKLDKLTEGLGSIQRSSIQDSYDKDSVDILRGKLDQYALKMDAIKQQVDSWLQGLNFKSKEAMETATESSQSSNNVTKANVQKLGLREMADSGKLSHIINDDMQDKYLAMSNDKHIEMLVDTKVEKQLSKFAEMLMAGKEREMVEMKNEVAFLRAEIEALLSRREEFHTHIEFVTQLAKEVNHIDGENHFLKSESASLKKQLQFIMKDELQARILLESFKKELDAEIENIRQEMKTSQHEGLDVKEEILALSKLEGSLVSEWRNLKKTVEDKALIQNNVAATPIKTNMEFAKGQYYEGETVRERTLIMERVENLSSLYLGGLEEVRTDLLNFKLHCHEKLEELARNYFEMKKKSNAFSASGNSVKEPTFESLHMRILNLEKEHDNRQALEHEKMKAEQMLSNIQKHQELASIAAGDAAGSAQKIDILSAELLGSFTSEMEFLKKKSTKLQESLANERDTAMALISEVKRSNDAFTREKDSALASLAETGKQSRRFQEDLERGVIKLKCMAKLKEKEHQALSMAASDVLSSSAKAKELLEVMSTARNECLQVAKLVETDLNSVKNNSAEVAHQIVAEMTTIKRTISELTREIAADMDDAKRKGLELANESVKQNRRIMQLQEAIAADMAAMALKAQTLLADINCSRRNSLELQEAVASDTGSYLANAQESLKEITNLKQKALNLQEKMAADAVTLAAKAEEVLTVARSSVELQEATAAESKSSASKVAEVLEELATTKKRTMHCYDSHDEAMRKFMDVLQDRCSQKLHEMIHGWKDAMHSELMKARSINEELEEVKRKGSCLKIQYSCVDSGRTLTSMHGGQSFQKNGSGVEQLCKTVEHLETSCRLESRKNSQDQMQHGYAEDINHLNKKVEAIVDMLELVSHPTPRAGQELDIFQNENSSFTEKLMNLGKKIWKVENQQVDLIRNVEQMQANINDLENSAAEWVHSHKLTLRVLNEIDRRLEHLETSLRADGNSENLMRDEAISGELLSLDKDVPGTQTSEVKERILHSLDVRETGSSKPTETRLITLESRIQHVASASYTNLRILDKKIEHISIGVQTALEGAAMAESKCTALGAEIVKVFCLLAKSSKISPTKRFDNYKGSEGHRVTEMHPKGKTTTLSTCIYCKKSSQKKVNDSMERQIETKGQEDKKDSWSRFLESQKNGGQSIAETQVTNAESKLPFSWKSKNCCSVMTGPKNIWLSSPSIRTTSLQEMKNFTREKNEDCVSHCQKPLDSYTKLMQACNSFHCNFEAFETVSPHKLFKSFTTKAYNVDDMPFQQEQQDVKTSLERLHDQHKDPKLAGQIAELKEAVAEVQSDGACQWFEEKRDTPAKMCRSNTRRNCQKTNIRLDSGDIHVNVSHKLNLMTGMQETRKS